MSELFPRDKNAPDIRIASFLELEAMYISDFEDQIKKISTDEQKAIIRKLSISELEKLGYVKVQALLIGVGSTGEAPEFRKLQDVLNIISEKTPSYADKRRKFFRNRRIGAGGKKIVIDPVGVVIGSAGEGDMNRTKLMDEAMDYLTQRQYTSEVIEQMMLEEKKDKNDQYELMIVSPIDDTKIEYYYKNKEVLKKYYWVNYPVYAKAWDSINLNSAVEAIYLNKFL